MSHTSFMFFSLLTLCPGPAPRARGKDLLEAWAAPDRLMLIS